MPDRVRGICCARRLPPNFGGPRSIMDISIFHILRFRCGTSIEKGREEGVRRRSEKIRVVFEQVSLPSSSPGQYSTPGAIEQPASQPPGLPFRKLSFQMFANRLRTCATATFIPVYLSLRRIDRTRSPIVFNRFVVSHGSIISPSFPFFFFFFKKEFFYTSLFLIFKYFPKVKTYLDTSYLTTL